MNQDIKLPPLPEPDWYLVMSTDGDNVNVELRASDEDAVNAALDMGGVVEIHRLITLDKAEAYTTATIGAALQSQPLTVDALAQEIRRVNGNNALGAGALAEALMPFLKSALQSKDREDAERLDWLEEQAQTSRTGVSIDYVYDAEDGYVNENGYRFMRHRFIGPLGKTARDAIDHARRIEDKQ